MKMLNMLAMLVVFSIVVLALPVVRADVGLRTVEVGHLTSGFYDHHIIEYNAAPAAASSPAVAAQLAHGLIVYHIVDANGNRVAAQCARLTETLPNIMSDCNVLNFIPTDIGYTGGSWQLEIFQWNAGTVPHELSMDSDITDAAAANLGTITATGMLVRCPLNNFSTLR